MTNTTETQKLIKKILASAEDTGRKPDPLLEEFIRFFYLQAPLEYLVSVSPAYLYAAARQVFEFIRERKPASLRKVRIYNPTVEEHGWKSERTIIETCVSDSPFILDSVTAEIASHRGYRIYEVIHPVLNIERDMHGRITQMSGVKHDKGKSRNESVTHFQITHIPDEEIKILEKNINDVLYCVSLAVADWQKMRAKTDDIIDYLDKAKTPFNKPTLKEVKDFLDWVNSNNFTYLGFREYDFVTKNGKDMAQVVKGSELGIFRSRNSATKPKGLTALPSGVIKLLKQPRPVEITKSNRKSLIHRPVPMDYIGIKKFDKNGKVTGEFRILGLFTSSVYFQSAKLIPIIRKKLDTVIKQSGFTADGHKGKAVVAILEDYPRDELLQIPEENLYDITMGIVELSERPRTKLFVRQDRFSRFVSCLVFVPRERFNTQLRQKVQLVLENAFEGKVTDYYTQVTESPLARIHVMIETRGEGNAQPNVAEIERELLLVTNSWIDGLRSTLIDHLGEREGEKLFHTYVDAFPESFKDHYHFGGTYCDILKIEEALRVHNLTMDLYQLGQDDEFSFQLKLYHPESQVTLSDIMPTLENMGFHAIDELTFFVTPKGRKRGVWVHHFRLYIHTPRTKDKPPQLVHIKNEFEKALFKLWHREAEDDALNKLVMRAGLTWREVMLLRTYCKYIRQIAFPYDYGYIINAIAAHPLLARKLVELFYTRFGVPADKDGDKRMDSLVAEIRKGLIKVDSVAEDRIINQVLETMMATLRTNFFQQDKFGECKSYISCKFDSKNVPNLPLPRPYAEIFVYSADFEGVHLRGGKVARGGLRWSDRKEDFRTEVLGLVKAQMVKNTVIVPVGSKGGFVVKRPVDGDRDAVIRQGIACYKTYLSGLLDITDNIVNGKIVPPANVIRYDGDDPYLVVAADKGTATFSDIANSMSESYNFWLGDAFASGGSNGYDHKKMGITARGGWVAVRRHFLEMGKDVQKDDFTVIGIGDMSGDVFGNGMLLSKHIRLIAAFSHNNIFIDPDPDAAKSYKERQRMFKLPRSTWMDYDKKLISKGGGVFDRKAKTIPISKEMKERFDIKEKSLTPDELIKRLLLAEADLLWNGGIGTYIKASDESHDSVGDRTNDAVRINGKEARFRVIGEGGNLGLTQRGRIEYAMRGGHINTDAIDNSAGVDCSDHEVNIKIALNHALVSKKLSPEARNTLLSKMTDEVGELVLRDNFQQTQTLTIAEFQGRELLEAQRRLIYFLEHVGLLDRKVEFLPDDETLAQRQAARQGLTRPELAVLLGYVKLYSYEDMLKSNLPDDPYLVDELIHYFPTPMQQKFRKEIENHELRREIIATIVCNSIINRMGLTFFHRMVEDSGIKSCDIARSYIAARDAFNTQAIWTEIEELGGKVPASVQAELFIGVKHLIERASSWLLRNMPQPIEISKMVDMFAPGIKELGACLDKIMAPGVRSSCAQKMEKYLSDGVPESLARKIARLEALSSGFDIVYAAAQSRLAICTVGEVYYAVGTRLKLGWLRANVKKLTVDSHWHRLSVKTLTEDFYDEQRRLTGEAIKSVCKEDKCDVTLRKWEDKYRKDFQRFDLLLEDLLKQESLDLAMLTVALRRVEEICAV